MFNDEGSALASQRNRGGPTSLAFHTVMKIMPRLRRLRIGWLLWTNDLVIPYHAIPYGTCAVPEVLTLARLLILIEKGGLLHLKFCVVGVSMSLWPR